MKILSVINSRFFLYLKFISFTVIFSLPTYSQNRTIQHGQDTVILYEHDETKLLLNLQKEKEGVELHFYCSGDIGIPDYFILDLSSGCSFVFENEIKGQFKKNQIYFGECGFLISNKMKRFFNNKVIVSLTLVMSSFCNNEEKTNSIYYNFFKVKINKRLIKF